MRELVIHGHFYQPPREDPWLELVPRELSAAPDHDWNERITRQCYAPLARAPVVDQQGRLVQLVNAYAWCSFDIGPSLFRWFDAHAPDVAAAIIAGDRESAARVGQGNAIAMPYHHVILPLLSRRDKVTEVRWGIRDFQRRFGRDPAGMWLPETAADDETLDVLAAEGIRFTVLAPAQVEGYPPFGRPGRWAGNGRELALFIYDGPAAHYVAFGGALDNVPGWEAQLGGIAGSDDGGPTIVSLATDGETFGHHHPLGDAALAALIDRIGARSDTRLTNYSALLEVVPPTHNLTLVSPSSWSCPHGVDRWRRECGCRYEPGTSQAWRTPLRNGLERLHAGVNDVVQHRWPAAGGDFWSARDDAGPNLDGRTDLGIEERTLLEIGQHALAMFTSCAWFFDDIGRLEPRIVLRHAARALELLGGDDAATLAAELLATLQDAHSNDPAKGDGAAIWYRDVLPAATGVAHLVAAIGALRELAPDALADVAMPAHDWRLESDDIVLIHRRTGRQSRWRVDAMVRGVVATHAGVRAASDGVTRMIDVAAYPEPFRRALNDIATPLVFDAALGADDAAALRAGLLDRAAARDRAVAGAVRLIQRDGIDAAAVVLHAVLDLFELDGAVLSAAQRADAFQSLAAQPVTASRRGLAERIGIDLGEARGAGQ